MALQWRAIRWGAPEDWELAEVDVPDPGPGEVTIGVRAAGVNPADAKHVASAQAGVELPVPIGYEVSGEILAIGPGTVIGSGDAKVGDAVLAFRVQGGYATQMTVAAEKAFAKPGTLTHSQAANLLLAGTTAAEMLAVSSAARGETVLLHAASGAVGVSVLQQAALRGVQVVGTASPARFEIVRRFGGVPVAYGPGLAQRVRDLVGDAPIAAAMDAAGTDEAADVSLALVADRGRIVTIANGRRASAEGFTWIRGSRPESARFRDAVRPEIVRLAAAGSLVVPMAREFPLAQAPEALRLLADGHPGGKIALVT